MKDADRRAGCASRRPLLLDLVSRYRQIFAAAWTARDQLAGPRRLADEAAFLPAVLSLQETPPHPAPRRVAITVCALFLVALAWSIFGRVDIVAVAQGRIVVSDRTKTVQPLETSVVQHVLVRDGDAVSAGQVLVELDATNANADGASLQEQTQAATSEQLRTASLMYALRHGARGTPALQEPPELDDEWRAGRPRRAVATAQLHAEWQDVGAKLAKFGAELARRQAEIATVRQSVGKLEATLPIARQRESDIRNLTEQGFMSGHASQDRTRERIELERDLATQQARLLETEAAWREAEQARLAYLAETQRALSERHAEATLRREQLAQESSKAAQRSRLTRLTAPVGGTVQQVAVHTEGGVVTPAQILMVVVPRDAEVSAEVVIDNKDIGFVNAGQVAEVNLETFPFTRYGIVPAVVRSVTADAVNDEKRGAIFPAVLTLGQGVIDIEGKQIKLGPGMNLSAEIKTGQRRVIDYLLSPIEKTLKESLGER